MAITFQNRNFEFQLKEKTRLKKWVQQIIALEKCRLGQLNFAFTSDEELLQVNQQYLNHNTYTDIITFDYCEGNTIHGDILISVERVRENAIKFSIPFEQELARVMIHGVFHLCGYGDKTKKEAEEMRKKENGALKKRMV